MNLKQYIILNFEFRPINVSCLIFARQCPSVIAIWLFDVYTYHL